MPKNLSGVQAGTVQQNDVNDPSVRVIRGKNNFPQSFVHPSTCRYGEVDPVMAFKAERGDVVPYKFVTDLNTFTLASPLKSEVNMYSAAFKVPMQAIYPRNWDIMMPIPNKGDDVPANTRCLFNPAAFITGLSQGIDYAVEASRFPIAVRNVFLLEKILSAGSLFSKFNMHFDQYVGTLATNGGAVLGTRYFFDQYFDEEFIPWLKRAFERNRDTAISDFDIIPVDGDGPSYIVSNSPIEYLDSRVFITFRRAVELLRSGEYQLGFTFDKTIDAFPSLMIRENKFSTLGLINIEPIVAYQIACSHFFTNTKIDFVYSAELFRDNMQSLLYGEDGTVPTFVWNGINKQYDVFSQGAFGFSYNYLSNVFNAEYMSITSFWYNLFSFNRSLRYGDYFTGARPEPLAVGDINAPVIDGSVNALDMTRKLQMTRLLNKVNISGPRISDYLQALFGGPMPEAPKDVPTRLSLVKFSISGFEVNNTGAQQASSSATNITTTNLRLTDNKFMFEANIDEPCWLIAVQYFDAHRIYSRTMDRFAFHQDRYDDFIPDMQFIGDQDVKLAELDSLGNSTDLAFAYNLRYMEYKQRYSYASGGFVRSLPSWAFITDNQDGCPPADSITPDYIRSSPSEFDRFYKSLTGYSLGTYFHFICTNTNVVSPYRQMVYAPEILA